MLLATQNRSSSSTTTQINVDDEVLRTPILVVDDVADNRELLAELLKAEGYQEIVDAESGIQALQILEQRPDIGLVLLDLMMPGIDGYETCRRMNHSPATADIPVIVVTGGALRRDEAILKSFACGAMDFLPKPVNEIELFGRVRSALYLYRERMRNRAKTQSLCESQQRFELAVHGANDGIWDLDFATRTAYYSPQWKRLLGYDVDALPSVWDLWQELIHPEDRDAVQRALEHHWSGQSEFFSMEHRLKTKSGDYKWFFCRGRACRDGNGTVTRMAGSITDVTARRQLESQLRLAEHWQTIAHLSAGVAHDFNNLLAIIMGHSSLLRLRLRHEPSAQAGLPAIEEAAHKAGELCKQLLAYSGQARCALAPIDLNQCVQSAIERVSAANDSQARFFSDLAPEPVLVKADAVQLGQALAHVLTNAVEALGNRPGEVSIGTSRITLEREQVADAVLVPAEWHGAYAQIEVSDTGCGIARADLKRIFDPFFSTKFTGRGLGLAAVLGIIKIHQGILMVASEPGRGTKIQILLPTEAQ
jgi:PAS domain S-box-containing protein